MQRLDFSGGKRTFPATADRKGPRLESGKSGTLPHHAPTAELRILATTDLHAHLMAYDYFSARPSKTVGLARTATLIRQLRAEGTNVVLFDNGDVLQGNPMSDWVAGHPETMADAPHPMFAAMNALGYDAGTLGNHEFNYGLGFLEQALRGAAFPIVSANVQDGEGGMIVPPFVILDRMITDADGTSWPIRIGVIGFAPPQIALWERISLGGAIRTLDIVGTARSLIPQMKVDGAEVIVALCHAGIGQAEEEAFQENAAVPLAAVSGIDAIVTGHTHQVFPDQGWADDGPVHGAAGLLHGKPAVMAGFHGSHLGVIDLTLRRQDGKWQVDQGTSRVVPIVQDGQKRAAQSDPDVMKLGRKVHRHVLARIRRPIGENGSPALQPFFLRRTRRRFAIGRRCTAGAGQRGAVGHPSCRSAPAFCCCAVQDRGAGGAGQLC